MKTKILSLIMGMLLLASIVSAQQAAQDILVTIEHISVSGGEIPAPFTGYVLTAENGKDFRLNGGLRVNAIALKGGLNKAIYVLPKNEDAYVEVADTSSATLDDVDLDTQDLGIFINNIPYQLGFYGASNLLDPSNSASESQLSEAGIDTQNDNGYILFTTGERRDVITFESSGELLFFKDASTANLIFKDENSQYSAMQLPINLHFERAELSEGLVGAGSSEEEALMQQAIVQQISEAGGQIEETLSGLSSSNPCIDNDEGPFPYDTPSYAVDIQGTIVADFCAGNVLYEAYCNGGGNVNLEQYTCESGCTNGACESAVTAPQYCVDTDQEITQDIFTTTNASLFNTILNTKGVTAGFYATESGRRFGIWTDYCKDNSNLVEYYCKGSQGRFVEVSCACDDGKCTQPPICIDTDGENIRTAGKAIALYSNGVLDELEDVCDPASWITESTLSNVIEKSCASVLDLESQQSVACESGEVCQSGRCMPEAEAVPNAECTQDSDCESGEICDENSNCIPAASTGVPGQPAPECQSFTDCSINQVCTSGNCVGEPAISLSNINAALDRRIAYADYLESVTRQVLEAHNVQPITTCDGDNVCELGENQACTNDNCQPMPTASSSTPTATVSGITATSTHQAGGFLSSFLSRLGFGTATSPSVDVTKGVAREVASIPTTPPVSGSRATTTDLSRTALQNVPQTTTPGTQAPSTSTQTANVPSTGLQQTNLQTQAPTTSFTQRTSFFSSLTSLFR